MSGNILPLLGLAKKAGRLEVGEEPVGAAARARQARLILVASDAAENSRRRASHFAEAGNVPWMAVPFTKAELGAMLGRGSCAMAALTDAGFAASVASKLAAAAPEYGGAAQALDVKAKKAAERQKEQRVHEKRLREGKSKPWAPPPARRPSAEGLSLCSKAATDRREPVPKSAPHPLDQGVKKRVPKGKLQIKGKLPRGPKPS